MQQASMQKADARAGQIAINIFAWALAVFLAFGFTLFGGIKLIGRQNMIEEFAQLGFGQWFRYFTGILEVTGALGVLIPKLRFVAAVQIAFVMAGATLANLFILHLPQMAKVTAILLALAALLAWLRRP